MGRPPYTRSQVAMLLWCGAAALFAPRAAAEPSVRVRASSRVELTAERAPGAIRVAGRLVDELDRPLADRELEILARPAAPGLPSERVHALSDRSGRFASELELPLGRYELVATHSGDAYHAAATRMEPLDLTRAPVTLRLASPQSPRVDLDSEAIELSLEASSSEGAADLRAEVRDELDRLVFEGRTDASGRVEGSLPRDLLDEPGVVRLLLHSQGDARRLPGHGARTIILFLRTKLELHARTTSDQLHVEGRLATSKGPLASRAIGLYLDGEHSATVLTNAQGRFAHAMPLSSLPPRQAQLEARFESDAPWWVGTNAGPVPIRVGAREPPSPLWLFAPLGPILLVIWRRRGKRRAASNANAWPHRDKSQVGVATGEARLSLRPSSYRVAGVVFDAHHHEAIETALVEVVGEARYEARSGAAGHFVIDALSSGQYVLRVTAPGFATEESTVVVPHRGEWDSLRVGLESLRVRAVRAYRPVAEAVLPHPRLWEQWTLRETLREALQKSGRSDDLESLTDRVERAAYARKVPTSDQVRMLTNDSRRVLEDLTGRPSSASGAAPEQES